MPNNKVHKNILQAIDDSNEIVLKDFYHNKPEEFISFWNKKFKKDKKIIKTSWTFFLLKDTLKTYLDYGKEFFKNGRQDWNWINLPWKIMTKEDKDFFGYDLNNINYHTIKNLNIDELNFIINNFLISSKSALHLIDNVTLNLWSIKVEEKTKIIRNKKLVIDRLLINTYLEYISKNLDEKEYQDEYKNILERQKILKWDFQPWIIDKLREHKLHIPDITNITPNKEMEILISKNIFKKL